MEIQPDSHGQHAAQLEQRKAMARDMAACYARVFLGSEDGKRVLADLRAKFGLNRLVFQAAKGQPYDSHAAALIDGQRQMMSEVESAIAAGAPLQASTAIQS